MVNNEPVSGNPSPSPRWTLAEKITAAVRRRWPAEIHAVGLHGALAHGDDNDDSDVDLVVVTYRPATGPRPGARRVEGTIVDLSVISADEYLGYARTLDASWPLAADRYVTTRALYDPEGWHTRLRDAHLGRLAEAGAGEFADLARDAWCNAETTYSRALRLAEWHDTAGALLTFGAARLRRAGRGPAHPHLLPGQRGRRAPHRARPGRPHRGGAAASHAGRRAGQARPAGRRHDRRPAQVTVVPISFPIRKVTPAAATPKKSCRRPLPHQVRLVNREVSAPATNNPTPPDPSASHSDVAPSR